MLRRSISQPYRRAPEGVCAFLGEGGSRLAGMRIGEVVELQSVERKEALRYYGSKAIR